MANMASPSTVAIPRFGHSDLRGYRFTYSYQLPARPRSTHTHSHHETNNHSSGLNSNLDPGSTMDVEKNPATPAGLLQLPIEIRRMIYHQLGFSTNHRRKVQTSRYAADEVSVRASYFFQSGDGDHNQRGVQRPLNPLVRGKGISTQVMRICKQIADETYELLYGDTNIGIGWDMATERGWYVGKNNSTNAPDSPMSALPFAPEPYPTFLGTRALSYLTHITLGPLSHPGYADPLVIYIRMLDYIAFRCRKLQFLGIHLSDKCQIPSQGNGRLEPFIDAISNVMRCCQLEKLWMGSARYAYENLDIDVARRLASKSKHGQMDECLATAHRRQMEARRDLIAADTAMEIRTNEFQNSRDKLGEVIDADYRVRSRKAEVLNKMDSLIRNWRRDMDASIFSWIPQTVVVAMNLQLSSYNQLVTSQELLATRMVALRQIDAMVDFITKHKDAHAEMERTEQEILEMKLRGLLDMTCELFHSILSYISCACSNVHTSTPRGGRQRRRTRFNVSDEELFSNGHEAKPTEPLTQIHQRIARMTELLPSSLSDLPTDFDPVLMETLPSPIDLGPTSLGGAEKDVGQSHRRKKFHDLRTAIVAAAKDAQAADTTSKTENITAAEARHIFAEHIGRLMSNMGFKTAPASPQKVLSSSGIASKGSATGPGSVEGTR